MNRRDAWVLREYDRELTITPDDREDMAYAREQREDIQAQKDEWEWECAKDDALTKEEPEWERPKYDSYWEKRELTEDEEYEVKHKMYEFQKQQRWEQDVAACQRSMRGGY
jgi:hypothetical protein